MKKLLIIVVVLLSVLAWASDKLESIESLKARADQAQPKDQVDLFTHIAERQLDSLDKAYNGGTVREAQAALADVVTYGVKAAQVSGATGKRMKQTEIAMRKISGKPWIWTTGRCWPTPFKNSIPPATNCSTVCSGSEPCDYES
jgi:hypothetical protein